MTVERWLAVVGYEGSYEVSDYGRVRSVDRLITLSTGRVCHYKGRLLKSFANEQRRVVTVNLVGRTTPVHKLVLTAFVGPCPDGMECCHWDDDYTNNHLSNLRWDTSTSNKHDMVRNGRHPGPKKDNCPFGHRLAAPNLRPNRKGRECLACHRASARKCDHALRGVTLDFQETSDICYREIMSD